MRDDCERIRDLIAGWITDPAQDPGQEAFRNHLDSCPACRAYLKALQEQDALLAAHFAAADANAGRRLEQLRRAIERTDESNQTNRIFIWRGIMRSRAFKTAIAAAILLAAAAGITHLGGRLDGAGVAWADVSAKLDQIRDYTYRARQITSSGVRTPGFELQQEWETFWCHSADFGYRWDQYQQGALSSQYYVLLKKQEHIWLHPWQKTFCRRPESLPEIAVLDPAGEIRRILAEPGTKLGRTTIDGVLVEGIEVQGQKVAGARLEDAVSRLWVNVETELPVWMESEGKVYRSDTYARLVWDRFQWNPGLTEADFTPVIPADFREEDWPEDGVAKQPDIEAAEKKIVEVDFGPLKELGLLNDDSAPPRPTTTLTGMAQIHAAQDDVMKGWPKYAELRDSLREELDRRLRLESQSPDDLVRIGILLREKFWDAGGDLSSTNCRYGYMARILLETAYAREPNDLAIGDELAETIMSVETMRVGDDFWPALTELRAAQFRQTRVEVENGRPPVWEDFARGCDLVSLLAPRQPEEAVPVVEWLAAQSQAGGWTAYLDLLDWMRSHLTKKQGLGYNIYAPGEFPEAFRYGGRLPSFRGPQKRAVVPSHPLRTDAP